GARADKLQSIEGQPPSLSSHPASCPFAARCAHVMPRCRAENPVRRAVSPAHDVACFWDPETGAARNA
ncbi:MAG: oligopeptide/dipeptide ABC transporter ATP-binding protein, partial [Pseudomonadota bacterium]